MKSDLMTGIAGAVFSGFYLVQATTVKVFGGAATAGVNAQTVPKIWGGCLLALSLVLIVRALLAMRKEKETKGLREILEAIRHRREVVYTFVLLILYAALMRPVGFILTSIAYILLQIWVLTPLEKRSRRVLGIAAGLAVFFSISLYFVFTKYLMVMLPPGILK
ncbi:MAG: tripartite tricarboxylate transporter TctB family protein [Mitsuokella sp.]|uniref:tripartite tricarboxylate transporter TctB family protein n=1 Tax=uncultured Mitsuokella sp. TaxID=453120 RepID=UPI00262BF976|nr:tripartite tricarboxylate transporter TctB family protein [uncultured Mitsuokella sp.]